MSESIVKALFVNARESHVPDGFVRTTDGWCRRSGACHAPRSYEILMLAAQARENEELFRTLDLTEFAIIVVYTPSVDKDMTALYDARIRQPREQRWPGEKMTFVTHFGELPGKQANIDSMFPGADLIIGHSDDEREFVNAFLTQEGRTPRQVYDERIQNLQWRLDPLGRRDTPK